MRAPSAPDSARQPAPVPAGRRADGRPWATPLARALARARQLDLRDVAPGRDGAVRAAQVNDLRAAPERHPATGPFHVLVADVDVTGPERALGTAAADLATREGARPTVFTLVVAALVRSLGRCPGVHADDVSAPVHLSVLGSGDAGWSEVPDAGSLGLGGLVRALHTPALHTPARHTSALHTSALHTSAHRAAVRGVAVVDSGSEDIDLELAPPPAGARAALTVGRVHRAVAVVTTDGAESIAVRSMIRLALAVDTGTVSRSESAALLRDLRTRLATGVTAAELTR